MLVCRAIDFPKTGVWPFSVREPLPEITIPLKADAAVTLPLQTCFNAAYEQGPYDTEVDYARPPLIPLRGEDAAWGKAVAKRAAHRP